jgi:drug/metabolite transporter (DMT)-like permease
MLAAVPLIAGSNLVAKVVAGRDRPEVVVFWQSLLAMLLFTPAGIWLWQTPTATQFVWFVAAAVLGTLGYLLITSAMRLLEITALQPITFLGIVWAAGFDWFLFGKTADLWTFIGAGIVIASTTYIAHREAKLASLA